MRDGVVFLVGVASPVIAFESAKLGSLGYVGWRDNWSLLIRFFSSQGAGGTDMSPLGMLLDRLQIVTERFFLSPGEILLLALVLALAVRVQRGQIRRFSVALGLGVTCHFVYWTWFAVPWPRYLYVAVLGLLFLIALALTTTTRWRERVALIAVVSIVLMTGIFRADWLQPLRGPHEDSFTDAESIAAYIELVHPTETIHTEWWAHAASLEYLSSLPHRYVLWNEPRFRGLQRRIVVSNSSFLSPLDDEFEDYLVDRCAIEVSAGTYSLYSCDAGQEPGM